MSWLKDVMQNSFIDELAKIAGKKERGKRDGTGPYKDSWQKRVIGKGKRQMAGEECPVKKKK